MARRPQLDTTNASYDRVKVPLARGPLYDEAFTPAWSGANAFSWVG